MVTKHPNHTINALNEFESCVVLDGNQTRGAVWYRTLEFESCVVLDGNQTFLDPSYVHALFESCVVLDGNQTGKS